MEDEIIRYPDGQISFKTGDILVSGKAPSFEIRVRINSYEDLFLVKSVCDAKRYLYPRINMQIFIPCLFGQRSDRRFSPNQSFDLKIICEFINSCNFERVTVFDPHSPVSIALLNNSTPLSSFTYVKQTTEDLAKKIDLNDLVLVSPDAGAYKKIFEFSKNLNIPVVAANKYRNMKGELLISFAGDIKNKNCLIVDDLCDGGRTFVELAKQLREQGCLNVYLYISHAYFSAGLDELRKYIDHIYCTNSVKDLPDSWFNGEGTVPVSDFVTQFKIL